MKKLVLGVAVVLTGLSAMASESVKVYHNKYLDAAVISVINTANQYDEMVVKDRRTNEVLLQRSLTDQSNLHEKIDFTKAGVNAYVIELSGQENVTTKEVFIVDDLVVNEAINVHETQPREMKFFVLDERETLIMSYTNSDETQLRFELYDLDKNKRVEKENMGRDLAFSNSYDLSQLRNGRNYRAVLYSGDKAYYYEFQK